MLAITTTKWRGPCAGTNPASQNPASPGISWDLDRGDLMSWTRALQVCQACPFRQRCATERDEMYGESGAGRPAGVIWAGVAYSDNGKILSGAGLRRLAAAHRGRRQLQVGARATGAA